MSQMSVSTLFIASFIIIIIFAVLAWKVKQKKNPELGFFEYIFMTNLDPTYIMVGMAGGLVFGFVDNAGLWFGMEALDSWVTKLLPNLSGKKLERIVGGIGNTYSDAVGAFLGTFIGVIISEQTGVSLDDVPIWSNALGVVIGCLIPVVIGYYIG